MDLANWGVGQFVYRVSLLLLYPTLVLLSLGLLKTMWHLGELVHDTWLGRSRRNMQTGRQLRDLALGEGKSLARSLEALAESRRQHPQLRRFVQNLLEELDRGTRATLPARLDHLVAQVEAELARDVNRVRVLVRLGPLLGLAGTLIPLGPALMALSEGDLSSLSAQLVVAFSTTVVGLLVGGMSYLVSIARAHTGDLVVSDIELVAAVVSMSLGLPREHRTNEPNARLEAEEVSA